MLQRDTIQGALVLDTVNKLRTHPTAEEIYTDISVSYPSISKATVYRNLNKLSEEGKIKKIQIPGKAERFDFRLDEHFHILCENCGKVSDVKLSNIPDLEKNIKDSQGYQINSVGIIFKGVCPKCLKNNK